MLKIAVCDDEYYVRDTLCEYLSALEKTLGTPFQVSCYASGEELLTHMDRETDILLLDIRMGNLSGMNAARTLRSQGLKTCLIFITSMVQYALEGYEVHAFAFVQKPLQYPQFERTMLDALRSIKAEETRILLLRRGGFIDSIPTDTILYVETLDHTSAIVTTAGRQEYTVSLKKLSEELTPWGFGLCHKSYLVNFRQIRSVLPSGLLLSNRESIPLSKHRRRQFLAEFTKYMGEQL